MTHISVCQKLLLLVIDTGSEGWNTWQILYTAAIKKNIKHLSPSALCFLGQEVRIKKLWFCPIAAHGCFIPLGDYSGEHWQGYYIIFTMLHWSSSPQMNLGENLTLWLNPINPCFGVVTYHFTDDYLQYPRFSIPIGVHLHSISHASGFWVEWSLGSSHTFHLSELPAMSLVSVLYVFKSCGQSALPFHHNSHFLALPPFHQLWNVYCLPCPRTLVKWSTIFISGVCILFVITQ